MTVAHRRAVDCVRSEQARRNRQHRYAALPDGAAESPSDAVIETLDGDEARRAMGKLSDVQRQALELAYYDGLTHAEIADHLGVALGTIKSRIRDGIIALRGLTAAHP